MTTTISQDQYETCMAEMMRVKYKKFHFTAEIMDLQGEAHFEQFSDIFIFKFKVTKGSYHKYCKAENKILYFTFKDYESFNSQFLIQTGKGVQNCPYHILHERDSICPLRLYSNSKEETCSICLESENRMKMEKTKCDHYFHLGCLNKWAEAEMKKKFAAAAEAEANDEEYDKDVFFNCPNCRSSLDICYCKDEDCPNKNEH